MQYSQITHLFSTSYLYRDSFMFWVSFFSQTLTDLKFLLEQVSQSFIGRQNSHLLVSLVFGSQQSLNTYQRHVFRVIGMLHVLSASGFNLRIVLKLVEAGLSRVQYFPKQLKTILVGLSGLVFFGLSSRSLSMQRAILTAGAALVVRDLLRRQLSALRLLIYLLIAWLILDSEVIGALSWQMSMAAVASIIWLVPLFSDLLKNTLQISKNYSRLPLIISKSLMYFVQNVSLYFAAQIGVMPILISTWGEVNFFGLVATLALSPIIMSLIYLALVWFGLCSMFELLPAGLFQAAGLIEIVGLWLTTPVIFFLQAADWLAGWGANYVWRVAEVRPALIWGWYLGWFFIGWLWRRSQVKKTISALQLIKQ